METAASRNLLIVQTMREQDPADWAAIKQIIDRKAPDIEVRISTNGQLSPKTAKWQVRRPSLVFSPVRLHDSPRGGAVYCGRFLGKDVQLRHVRARAVLRTKPLGRPTTAACGHCRRSVWHYRIGRHYVLEVNPHGAVWHLSSGLAKKMDPVHVRELYAQFNALELAADLLIGKTRAEAC